MKRRLLTVLLAAWGFAAGTAAAADAPPAERTTREVRVIRLRAAASATAAEAAAAAGAMAEAERAIARAAALARVAPVAPVSPAALEAYAPEPDSPASPPLVWEMVFPAGPRTFETKTDTTVKVYRGAALVLNNLAGDISVEAWKKDAVRIRAKHSKRDRIVVQFQRGALSIEAVNRAGAAPIVEYALVVPEWMAVQLSGIESDIAVQGMRAPVEADCMRGDIRVVGSHGPLQLSSVEGEVNVVDARDVRATSINNGVQLEQVVGQIEVESVNGDIAMRRVRSPRVVASSIGGSVVFSGAFEPRGHYRLVSHTGNLQVGVPVGAGVDVNVASWNGAFQTDLPLQVGRQRRGRQLRFTLGGGGSTLELESFQGLIQLLAPSELPPAQPPKAPRAPKAPQAPARPDEEKDR
ncbi:MAG: hypothetical protein U0704_07520 [Candidatus Eisenbacteria bacterium]